MNKTYTLQDGGTITATCATEFVTKLRQSSRFDSECTDQEYMYHFADRYHDHSGNSVRAYSTEHCFEYFLVFGYVSVKLSF